MSLITHIVHCWHTSLWLCIPGNWFRLKMVGFKKKVKGYIEQYDPNTRWKRCQCLCYITTRDFWRLDLHDSHKTDVVHWTVFCNVLTILNNDYAEKAHNVRGRSAISGADLGLVWWHLLCTVWLPILKEYSYTWTSGGLREESLFKAMSCLSPSLLSTLDLPLLAFWGDKIKRQLCIPTPKIDLDS